MEKLNFEKLKIEDQFSDPFPVIIYSNLLDSSQIDDLQKELSENNTVFDKIVMGNRKTILKGTKNFDNFLSKSTTGQEINSFFENESVFNFFYKNLENLNLKTKNSFSINSKNLVFLKDYIDKAGPATNRNIKFKFKNKLTKILSKVINENKIYCDFDFSVASNGYWKEPHHDKEERLISFLFYINDFESKNGGNLEIYKYNNEPNVYLREPNLKDLNMIKKIEPKKGHLVTFMSSPQSIHGVDVIKSDKTRYFFYGSYTSLHKINWLK